MVCQDRKDSRCCGFQGRQREVGGAKWRPRTECLQPSSMRMGVEALREITKRLLKDKYWKKGPG
jgi:hypothetical protein